jgi:hypothetical protein
MNRRELLAYLGGAGALGPVVAWAQQRGADAAHRRNHDLGSR